VDNSNEKPFWKGFFSVFKATPELNVAEWAAQRRVLPQGGSSTPGLWRNERTPYLVEIMEELSPQSRTKEIIFCKGSQIGATESAINWLMYSIDLQPGPFLVLQPTDTMAVRFSKQRLTASIQLCKEIRDKVGEGKRNGSSLQEKTYPGGYVVISGANSPASLASMPIGNIICDEIDRYPFSAGKEGDPLELVAARIATFPRAKMFFLSTPTYKETSPSWNLFLNSDQRYFYLPCPYCGDDKDQPNNGYFVLKFENLQWEPGKPETVMCYCPHCGGGIEEYQKTEMLKKGKWIAENPGHHRTGFHLSSLYSPIGWLSWVQVVRKFEAAGNDIEKRKTFNNTILGLPWEESGETIANEYLERRREQYICEVPPGVLLLTMSVDVQKDRLEYLVKGWGKYEECWAIEYGVLRGETSELISPDKEYPSPWQQLDIVRTKGFKRIDGTEIRIVCTMIDCGYNSDVVYHYTKPRERMRVFAVRGSSNPTKDIMNKPSRNTANRAAIFYCGTSKAKELIYSRLKIENAGPGYYHFPADEKGGFDAAFFAGLTCEKLIPVYKKNGHKRLEWHKAKSARNEPLDLDVYNLVAIRFLEKDLIRLTAQMEAMEKYEKSNEEKINLEKSEPKSVQQNEKPKRKYVEKNSGIHLAI
jgi:phage terminase large subunit GpA-like protein